MIGAAWEAVTLGQIALYLGLAGGGAGGLAFVRVLYKLVAAVTKALGSWQANLDAQTDAARATASLAPLQAEALRLEIRRQGGEVPSEEPDTDELRIARKISQGRLEEVRAELAGLDEGDSLHGRIGALAGELQRLEREVRDAARPEGRGRKITVVPTRGPGD